MAHAPEASDDEAPDEPGWPTRPPVAEDVARALLRDGVADVLGRMPWSSNATFLACLSEPDRPTEELLAIYKPQRGERPLWDFPRGTLCHREVAAYEMSEALGWDLVPDTVLRDGPAGIGMMQRFVEHDPEEHYFALLEEHGDVMRRLAAFDIVINNTDRKGGHCLRAAADGRIFAIDHGVAFHSQWKLRTVIWEFACEPIPRDVRADLERIVGELRGPLGDKLALLLDRYEVDAVRARTEHLLAVGTFPEPDRDYHSYPWPMI